MTVHDVFPEPTDSSDSDTDGASSASRPRREVRGFALYVEVGDRQVELQELVDALQFELSTLVPSAESHAVALQSPQLPAPQQSVPQQSAPSQSVPPQSVGAVLDFARFRVVVDGAPIHLTYKEFALLQALVRSDGSPLSRRDLKFVLAGSQAETISDRAVDVHIRRIRAKVDPYSDLIRTVHGRGYRFDSRRNVTVHWSGTPSPDRF